MSRKVRCWRPEFSGVIDGTKQTHTGTWELVMTKNMVPMSTGSSGVLSKLISFLVVLGVVAVVVKHPDDSAEWVQGLVDLCGNAVDGIASFLHTLAS